MTIQKPKILYFDYLPNMDYQEASGSGLGSTIFKLTALNDALQNGFDVHLITSPNKKQLLSGALPNDKVYTTTTSITYSQFLKCINLGLDESHIPAKIKSLKNYSPFLQADRECYKKEPHISFWRSFSARALHYEVPDSGPSSQLKCSSESLEKANQLLHGNGPYLALSYQSISTLKDYPYWQEVIDLLLKKHVHLQIILLGHKRQDLDDHKNIINLTGQTDISLLKALVTKADVVAGVDGLTTNLAMALKTPSVILFTMIAPEHIIPDLKSPDITYLTAPGCKYQYCYKDLINYRNSKCQFLEQNPDIKLPECLKFSPLLIQQAISKYL